MYDCISQPRTAKELREWIWAECGGIKRGDYWDHHVSWLENTREHGWLDRRDGRGMAMDVVACEIAESFPCFGIHDANDLHEWLLRHPTNDA